MKISGNHTGLLSCIAILTALLVPGLAMNEAFAEIVPVVNPGLQVQIERGAYVARAGDCIACHTAQNGKPFAGGRPMESQFGTIYSTNITPDTVHGIGRYSFEEFDKVMREGIARDGHHLYPAMPYTSFTKVSGSDMQALYTYFMQGVKAAPTMNRENEVHWPFSIRSLMSAWNRFYLKKGEFVPDANQSEAWNRGAYLVQGLGHCGACHTPRGVAGQEKAFSHKDDKHYLMGALIDNWFASNLTGDLGSGLHAWTKDEITEYLKTGRTARSAAFGAMAQVINKSTQYLTDQDLMAIAEYLKSLPAASGETAPTAAKADTTTDVLRAGVTDVPGAQLYLDNCNACHRSNGAGVARTFPALAKNEVVNAKDPTSLIHIVLTGSAMPSTTTAPSALAMPDFKWRLSDEEVAEVLSFVRSSWGNQAPAVDASDVARLRKATATKK